MTRRLKVRAAFRFAALLSCACLIEGAESGTVWLVVASTHRTVLPAMKAAAMLRVAWPEVTVIASSDCASFRAGFYLTVVRSAQSQPAAADLRKLKSHIPDANVRTCNPRPGTRIALGLPLIDASIANVPANSVNWTDEDRISTVTKLPAIGYLWIQRRYEPDAEDPREGRRESVFFLLSSQKDAVLLDPDCANSSFAQKDGWIALSCARELAADHMLHELRVLEQASGKAVFTAPRCREPRFESAEEVSCQAESVDAEGKLKLTAKRLGFRHRM